MSVQHRAISIQRVGNGFEICDDFVTIEEPLELRIEHEHNGTLRQHSVSVTMRTPGDDIDLAYGFLLSEGIVQDFLNIGKACHVHTEGSKPGDGNTVTVTLTKETLFDPESLLRHFYTSSSCGVCGKVSLAAVEVHVPLHKSTEYCISAKHLTALPHKLRKLQVEFDKTGGLHASALFDNTGKIVRLREDVGRHNALDKLIGSCRDSGIGILRNLGLLLSGRASFELLQKSAIAGIPFVASIGPPSSLAVDLARDQDITLVGFLKNGSFNLYHGDRLLHD